MTRGIHSSPAAAVTTAVDDNRVVKGSHVHRNTYNNPVIRQGF